MIIGFSIYPRKDSPFWWYSVKDMKSGKYLRRKTPFRIDAPSGKLKARMWVGQRVRLHEEKSKLVPSETWSVWVPAFLDKEYEYNVKTLTRYKNAWANLFHFLCEHQIESPRQVERAHARQYLDWRVQQKRACGKPINYNTAITELKVLCRLMKEAHDRQFIDANPLYQLNLKRRNVREKPEITDDEIAKIRMELKTRPEWMRVSFEIALHQGCRISETSIPLGKIDFVNSSIELTMKGSDGQPKSHFVPIHPDLRPLLVALAQAGRSHTCHLPPMASKEWHFFFKEIGLPHLCFHSTRVTVATRLARAGVPLQQAMAYLNHASETVHRVYLRLRAMDTAKAAAGALRFASTHGSHEILDAPESIVQTVPLS